MSLKKVIGFIRISLKKANKWFYDFILKNKIFIGYLVLLFVISTFFIHSFNLYKITYNKAVTAARLSDKNFSDIYTFAQNPKNIYTNISQLYKDIHSDSIKQILFIGNKVFVKKNNNSYYCVNDVTGKIAEYFSLNYFSANNNYHASVLFLLPPPENSSFLKSSFANSALNQSIQFSIEYASLIFLFILSGVKIFNKFEFIQDSNITFDDVIGAEEAKSTLISIGNMINKNENIESLGGKVPKGILLYGPAGVGKTLLAKAVAHTFNAKFISIAASELYSSFYGGSVSNVKKLFNTARKNSPCVIFIDEIDGFGKRSFGNESSTGQENNRVINQILTEIDGFSHKSSHDEILPKIIIIGATNAELTDLDPALVREGRFDYKVYVSMPDYEARIKLFKYYFRKTNLHDAENFDYNYLAGMSSGMSPASIAASCNASIIAAGEQSSKNINVKHALNAIEKIQYGDYCSINLNPDDTYRVAIHEASHAIVAHYFSKREIVKVSILPRNNGSLGITSFIYKDNRHLIKKSDLESHIMIILAGYCGEKIICGEASTCASRDLEQASKLIESMVYQYAMGNTIFVTRKESNYDYKEVDAVLFIITEKLFSYIDSKKDIITFIANVLIQDKEISGKCFLAFINEFEKKTCIKNNMAI